MEPGAMVIRHPVRQFRPRWYRYQTSLSVHRQRWLPATETTLFWLPLVTRQLLNCRAPAGQAETTHPAAM